MSQVWLMCALQHLAGIPADEATPVCTLREIAMSQVWLMCDLQRLAGTPANEATPVCIASALAGTWRCACSHEAVKELADACIPVSSSRMCSTIATSNKFTKSHAYTW